MPQIKYGDHIFAAFVVPMVERSRVQASVSAIRKKRIPGVLWQHGWAEPSNPDSRQAGLAMNTKSLRPYTARNVVNGFASRGLAADEMLITRARHAASDVPVAVLPTPIAHAVIERAMDAYEKATGSWPEFSGMRAALTSILRSDA